MKHVLIVLSLAVASLTGACQQNKGRLIKNSGCSGNPVTSIQAALQGNWMYGNFSMKEYWTQNPSEYLGNALQFAIAFRFNADGTYEQYFTSSAVMGGVVTYQQSVTRGTVVINPENSSMITYPCTSHYKRTKNGRTVEERDLLKSELNGSTTYRYSTGQETNGTKAIYLTLGGTGNPITFLQRF
ncbi:MAG: hypothetical protein NTW29_19295 [Bacteroidetes bacterium]|nr:hypothetical protein [Bacteroidota bacterium]